MVARCAQYTAQMEKMLLFFERKILRRIGGLLYDDQSWDAGVDDTNAEIRKNYAVGR